MKRFKILGNIFSVLIFVFLLAPLVVVICTSFGESRFVTFPPQGFTLKWYAEAFGNVDFMKSILLSLRISIVSVILACVMGVMVSMYFWKKPGRVSEVFETVFLSPIVVPTVISALAFLQYFSLYSALSGFWKLVLAYITIEMPYVIRSVTASLSSLDASFEEASLVMGASPFKTMYRVTLPCIKGGIAAGAIFAFVVAFDEAVIVMFIRNARTVTYPLRLYSYIMESFTPLISALASIFIIISAILIIVLEKKIGLEKMY
ncbi:MAG: ABC transporter permease [Oscillospiraceae bacterium]|nr:ABC transporter permease [Oscillospiraceae bacterium]MBR6207992.1 ABC transporter permease [Oscillospiraceae bacterium]